MFEKRLSHTADSQDQRHRMVPASRPMMTLADTISPDYVTPRLIRQNAAALRSTSRRWPTRGPPRTACWRSACRSSTRCTCCPNAKALRLVESGSFIALQHKWTLRTCFNAQEEIYLASMDEISQVQAIHPQLGRYLGPPCVLRNKIVSPRCTEGSHFCGVPVWKSFPHVGAASDVTPILPWIAHLYTATGAVIALLATGLTFAHNFRGVFIYFVVATFVDATDGWLARALRVKERLPKFDGGRLDDIVDYLTYVFIPALVVWQAGAACRAVSGVRGDGAVERLWLRPDRREDRDRQPRGGVTPGGKLPDHFFTGFPSYWNIVVVYLFVLGCPRQVNARRSWSRSPCWCSCRSAMSILPAP